MEKKETKINSIKVAVNGVQSIENQMGGIEENGQHKCNALHYLHNLDPQPFFIR